MEETKTIKEAKEYLREHSKEGVDCPCCGQRVQFYERSIYSSMALSLIRLFNLTRNYPDKTYFHIRDFTIEGKDIAGDFSKFRYWGLAVEREKDENDTTKRTSGYWAITEKGKKYVLKQISVPKKVIIYNKRSLGFSEDEANISDALGKNFDYQELMSNSNIYSKEAESERPKKPEANILGQCPKCRGGLRQTQYRDEFQKKPITKIECVDCGHQL